MNPFGAIQQPTDLKSLDATTLPGSLTSAFVKGLIIFAAFYALINLIFAGYNFMSAGDDPKKVSSAWTKIYQTILGLVVAAGAFTIAAIVGKLVFDNPMFLLQPKIPTL